MAASLFFRDGYHVGVDRIIKESGVAKMTFYKHFPAKTDLICGVISGASRQIERRVTAIAADQTLAPPQQANRIFDFLCDCMLDPSYKGGLITRALVEITDDHSMARKVAQFGAWLIFSAIMRACLKTGTHDAMIGRQIYLFITGGSLLSPLIGEGPALQAVKTAIGNVLSSAGDRG